MLWRYMKLIVLQHRWYGLWRGGGHIYIIYVAPAGVPFFYKFSQVYQYVIFPCTLSTQIRMRI